VRDIGDNVGENSLNMITLEFLATTRNSILDYGVYLAE
jgi:hypothetical protein